jgi:hypothetical protein
MVGNIDGKIFGRKKNVVMTFEILETCKNVARTHM